MGCSERARARTPAARLRRVLAALLWLALAPAFAQAPAPQRIAHAELLASDADAPPSADAAWSPTALPVLVRSPHRPEGWTQRWLRLHLELAAVPAAPLALYLPSINRSARVFVNGTPVATIGSFELPMPLNWNRAQLVVLPPALLHAGDNPVHVQLRSYDFETGFLAAVTVGDEAALGEALRERRFWQNDIVMILGGTMAASGLFLLGVWLGRRQQTMYLFLGLAMLAWAYISLDYYACRTPVGGFAWERTVEVAQVLHAVLIFLFVLRRVGRRVAWLEAGLWLYWGIGSLLDLTDAIRTRQVEWWYQGTLAAALYFLGLLVVDAWRKDRSAEVVLLAVAATVSVALSGYDLWLFTQHSWTERLYLAHFGAPLYMAAVGWTLIQRAVQAMSTQEALNLVLEQRVAAQTVEVERRMAELIEARRSEAVARERARLMGEMHDGIGSQLTTALALVEREEGGAGRIAQALRESIDDLQLIIDSLEPVGHDLLTTLGMLRYRVQRRLQQGGIAIEWNVQDLPPLPVLTPQNVLSILRVLQEAFANVIKHSGATRIAVATALDGAGGVETARIRIADDGRGFDGRPGGRGIASMRRRAQALGGELRIDSSAAGTMLELRIPTGRTPPLP